MIISKKSVIHERPNLRIYGVEERTEVKIKWNRQTT